MSLAEMLEIILDEQGNLASDEKMVQYMPSEIQLAYDFSVRDGVQSAVVCVCIPGVICGWVLLSFSGQGPIICQEEPFDIESIGPFLEMMTKP